MPLRTSLAMKNKSKKQRSKKQRMKKKERENKSMINRLSTDLKREQDKNLAELSA